MTKVKDNVNFADIYAPAIPLTMDFADEHSFEYHDLNAKQEYNASFREYCFAYDVDLENISQIAIKANIQKLQVSAWRDKYLWRDKKLRKLEEVGNQIMTHQQREIAMMNRNFTIISKGFMALIFGYLKEKIDFKTMEVLGEKTDVGDGRIMVNLLDATERCQKIFQRATIPDKGNGKSSSEQNLPIEINIKQPVDKVFGKERITINQEDMKKFGKNFDKKYNEMFHKEADKENTKKLRNAITAKPKATAVININIPAEQGFVSQQVRIEDIPEDL